MGIMYGWHGCILAVGIGSGPGHSFLADYTVMGTKGCRKPFPPKQGCVLGLGFLKGSYAHLLRHCIEDLDPLCPSLDS